MVFQTSALLLALSSTVAWAGVPDIPAGYSQVLFSDDFDGAAGSPPSNSWQFDLGTSYPGGFPNWGTGEIESYTSNSDNVALDGSGNLLITPLKDSNNQWTSARIETVSGSFGPPANGKMRVESSIAMPAVNAQNGLGYWPTFWLMGSAYRTDKNTWPAGGEIDIMENANGVTAVRQTLHCGTLSGGPCDETNGDFVYQACPNSDCNGNYHTYAVDFDRTVSPETMTFSVDGNQTKTIVASDLGEDTWSAAIDHDFYIILNVAMGGALPNALASQNTPTDATEPGIPMYVDYVAVWST